MASSSSSESSSDDSESLSSSSSYSDEDEDDDSDDDATSTSSSLSDLSPPEFIIDNYTLDDIFLPSNQFWGKTFETIKFDCLEQFEQTAAAWEAILQSELVAMPYNTYSSFVDFYDSWSRSKKNNFGDFLVHYRPKYFMADAEMNCVGMSCNLLNRLKNEDKQFGHGFGLISCEEEVTDIPSRDGPFTDDDVDRIYDLRDKHNIKEHCFVGAKILIQNRVGMVFFDLGYHISRPIIAMSDKQYPHTGWFSSGIAKYPKEYSFELTGNRFAIWKVRQQSPTGIATIYSNLLYVERQYSSIAAVRVSAKRSQMYGLKSYIVRDRKGIAAGFYSSLGSKYVTIFKNDAETQTRITEKFSLAELQTSPDKIKESLAWVVDISMDAFATIQDHNIISNSNYVPASVDELLATLHNFARVMNDEKFLNIIDGINRRIDYDIY